MRADLAEVQVGRQARSVVVGGQVAALSVAVDADRQEIAQPLARAGFAGRPHVSHAARPVRLRRMQIPVIDVVGRGSSAPAAIVRGSGDGSRNHDACLQRLPERREHLEVAARAGLDRERLDQQRAVEAVRLDPSRLERRLDPLVDLAGRAIAAVPVDGFGACLRDQFRDHRFGRPLPQDQAPALGRDPLGRGSAATCPATTWLAPPGARDSRLCSSSI